MIKEFAENIKTIVLATVTQDNTPVVSYTPYVMRDNKVYILISKIAEHYDNIEKNKKVSIMMIQDEKESRVLFARKRLSFSATGEKVSGVPEDVLKEFEEVHTKQMMDTLLGFDFDFFRLDLEKGRLVEGFGRAFDLIYVDGQWNQEHVTEGNGGGHGK